jgi:hypothetical protein
MTSCLHYDIQGTQGFGCRTSGHGEESHSYYLVEICHRDIMLVSGFHYFHKIDGSQFVYEFEFVSWF